MEKTKRIVIVKNLPSNIIEEAIVVVKDKNSINEIINRNNNIKIQGNLTESQINRIKSIKQEKENYIIKEAELVISDYIESIKMKNNKFRIKALTTKYRNLKYLNAILFIMVLISTFIIALK